MDNYELLLTEQAQENIEDTLATLITAAQEIATASEKDFEKIKAKKWYKRLWELVTFNNDNQKIQARGVGNLAKLNEITMKAIVLVSKQSKDISEKVHESLKHLQQLEEDVSDLYEQQIKIISVVQRIKRGFETEDRFDELSQNQRDIIFAVLHTYALEGSNDDTGNLLATLRGQAHDTYANVNYSIIETELTPQSSQKMLYSLLHAYSLLLTGEFANEDHEILQYIRLSGNEKKEIRNRVKDDISIYGKDKYIKFFDAPTEEYDFDVDANDIEWDFCENEDTSKAETSPQMETIHITKLTQIHVGERLQFYKKNVYIEANIDCHGELEFFGCNVYYNAGASIGKITLSPESQLNIWNSQVFGGPLDEMAFIRGKQADISCLNSAFHNCQRFINVTDSEFGMDKCGVYNCIREFVCVDNGINSSVENTLIILDDPTIIEDAVGYQNEHKGLSSPMIFDIDRWCEYKNNLFYCPFEFKDSLWLTVFWGDHHSVEDCTFITLGSQNIHYSSYPKTINNCLFVGGSNVISLNGGGLSGNSNLSSSMFIGCKNAVSCSKDVIKGCVFVDCFRTSIEAKFFGSTIIEDCVFMNTKVVPKEQKDKYGNEIGPCINVWCSREFMEKGKNKPNTINNCIFYNLNNYDYIIAPSATGKPEEVIAQVENCRFINCDCVRAIQKDTYYYSDILSIKKTVRDVMKVVNCEGVDLYGWRRNPEKTISNSEINVDLTEKPYGCEYLTSVFYFNHDLISDDKLRPWISDFEQRVIAEME
jgi:hypothetical protein